MYGWRAKIGLLIPMTNNVIEPEFNRLSLHVEGVAVYASRMATLGLVTFDSLLEMQKHVERAAQELAAANVDVLSFGCTTGSLLKGFGWDQEIIKRIEAKTGIRATTTASAVVDALQKIKIKNISVATPYTEELNKKEVEFLRAHGFNVVKIKGLGLVKGIGDNPPEVAYRLAKEVDVEEAQGIFISCTNFRTIEIIEKLERDLQKPVITSNQATFWKVLRIVGINDKIKGYGSLLRL